MADNQKLAGLVDLLEKEKLQQMSDAHQEDGEDPGVDPSRVMSNIEKLDHLNKQVVAIRSDQVNLINAIKKDLARLSKLGERAIAEATRHLEDGS